MSKILIHGTTFPLSLEYIKDNWPYIKLGRVMLNFWIVTTSPIGTVAEINKSCFYHKNYISMLMSLFTNEIIYK